MIVPLLFRAIAVAWVILAPQASAAAEVGSPVVFASAARGRAEQVRGYLSVPSMSFERYPLMLILHSSGGLHARDWFFARTLNGMGVATFVIDSFGPRGLIKVPENKQSFGEWEMAIDALAALESLRTDARLDFTRLGVMGRSLGGQTATRLALQASRDQLPRKGPLINLALAITPGCTSQQQDRRMTSGSQAWLFLAEKDASPYTRCVTYVEKMKAAGGDAQFKLYANAFHTFDGSPTPVWHSNEEVYAGCENDRINRHLAIRLDTGGKLRSRTDWSEFFSACVKRGMWTGGDPEATQALDQDWTEVVRRRWFQ